MSTGVPSETRDAAPRLHPSRRALVKGAAWAAPVAAMSVAAPAYALSVPCPTGTFTALARGKALSGGLFNVDLDTLASVDGVIASAPGTVTEAGVKNGPQAHGDPDEHHDPLSVTALSSINVNATGLSTTLSSILGLVAPADTGTVNQYAYAASGGLETGASGYVTDGGTLRTGGDSGYPQLGSLDLKQLLTPLLGSGGTATLATIANLKLDIGAVAGRAEQVAPCATDGARTLERDYLLAHLRLKIESDLVKNLASTIGSAVLGLNVLGVAGLTIDTSVLTNGPLPSGSGQPIQADLSSGVITVDIGALLGGDAFGANYSQWLNGQPPNSLLFVDTPLPSGAITTFMNGLITGLQDRLLDAVSVTILGNTGTLRDLKKIPGVGTTLTLLINTINALFTNSGPVKTALDGISSLLATVFGWLVTVINIRVNAQNLPGDNNPSTGAAHDGPVRWNSLPAGRYDVAAIGISAVQNATLLDLFLGRGSVGPLVRV